MFEPNPPRLGRPGAGDELFCGNRGEISRRVVWGCVRVSRTPAKSNADQIRDCPLRSGGTTCLTLLVSRRRSSTVASHIAKYGTAILDTTKRTYNK